MKWISAPKLCFKRIRTLFVNQLSGRKPFGSLFLISQNIVYMYINWIFVCIEIRINRFIIIIIINIIHGVCFSPDTGAHQRICDQGQWHLGQGHVQRHRPQIRGWGNIPRIHRKQTYILQKKTIRAAHWLRTLRQNFARLVLLTTFQRVWKHARATLTQSWYQWDRVAINENWKNGNFALNF